MKPVDIVKEEKAREASKSIRLKNYCGHIEETNLDGIFVYDCTIGDINTDEFNCKEPCTLEDWKTCPYNKVRK